jgi:hypothetical protein
MEVSQTIRPTTSESRTMNTRRSIKTTEISNDGERDLARAEGSRHLRPHLEGRHARLRKYLVSLELSRERTLPEGVPMLPEELPPIIEFPLP